MTDFKELVYRGVESDVLDYKAPVNWTELPKQQKAKFVRHALAFANTCGGAIVIGVREDASGRPVLYEGLDDLQCHSFDPSTVTTYINSHVDPAIDITVERPQIDGKYYAILIIKPFRDIPHVAVHSIDEELRSGVFYIRTASASSRPAARAGEMHDLVRRALRNQRDLLGNLLKEVLGERPVESSSAATPVKEIFPLEYNESVEYFSKRIGSGFAPDTPVLDIAIMPEQTSGQPPTVPLSELRTAVWNALQSIDHPETWLDNADLEASYATNVSLRGISKQRDRFWQLFQNKLMHFRCVLPDKLEYKAFAGQLSDFFELVRAIYTQKLFACRGINCQLTIEHSNNMQLIMPENLPEKPGICRIDQIRILNGIELSTLQKDPALVSEQILKELTVRFNA
ncbi:MAG: ATP-binding protein [Lentisphaerae bacterium]|nr:ATP-binding protein [Lentisphaerota bacterium]